MFSKECRICLRREEHCVSLFAKRRGTKLAEIIRFCARVEIAEDDGLPGDACSRCVDEALNAYLFVNKCRRSDAELRTAQAFCKDGFKDDDELMGKEKYGLEKNTEPGDVPNKVLPPEIEPYEISSVNELDESRPNSRSHTNGDSPMDQMATFSNNFEDDEELTEKEDNALEEITEPESEQPFNTENEDLPKKTLSPETESNEISSVTEADGTGPKSRSITNDAGDDDAVDEISLANEYEQCDMQESDGHIELTPEEEPFHMTSEDVLEENEITVMDIKPEVFKYDNDEEGDGFLIEYLDDDYKSDSIPEGIIEDDQILEYEQDEIEFESHTKANVDAYNSKSFLCCGTRCRAVFNTQEDLEEHSRLVHLAHRDIECKDKPFECNRCFSRFSTGKSLALHSRKYSQCPLCSQGFFTLKDKRLHMHQAHGESLTVSKKASATKICCGCYKSFNNDEELQAHSEEQHSIRKSAVDETRPLQCEICYKRFRTLESLRIHQRFVYRPKHFVCTTCNRAFDTKSKLINHELVHSDTRNFQCNKCEKCFKKEIDLKSHVLLHNEKQEVCTVCGLRFHRKSNLKMHMRKHQDTFFYACPDCPKQFKNNSHLKEHYKVHSKQKPYVCSYCNRSFAYYSDRKRHEMTHTGNYPFVCSCSKKFARKTTFDKHMAICQDKLIDEPSE